MTEGLLHKKYLPLRSLPFSSYLHRQTRRHNLENIIHFQCCPLSQRYTTISTEHILLSLQGRCFQELRDQLVASRRSQILSSNQGVGNSQQWDPSSTTSSFYTLCVSYRTYCKFGLSCFFTIPMFIFFHRRNVNFVSPIIATLSPFVMSKVIFLQPLQHDYNTLPTLEPRDPTRESFRFYGEPNMSHLAPPNSSQTVSILQIISYISSKISILIA